MSKREQKAEGPADPQSQVARGSLSFFQNNRRGKRIALLLDLPLTGGRGPEKSGSGGEKSDPVPLILIPTPFAGSKEDLAPAAAWCTWALGAAVLRFSFTNNLDESDGELNKFLPKDEDFQDILDFVLAGGIEAVAEGHEVPARIDYARIGVLALSMSGMIAMQLAARRREIAGVAFLSFPASLPYIIDHKGRHGLRSYIRKCMAYNASTRWPRLYGAARRLLKQLPSPPAFGDFDVVLSGHECNMQGLVDWMIHSFFPFRLRLSTKRMARLCGKARCPMAFILPELDNYTSRDRVLKVVSRGVSRGRVRDLEIVTGAKHRWSDMAHFNRGMGYAVDYLARYLGVARPHPATPPPLSEVALKTLHEKAALVSRRLDRESVSRDCLIQELVPPKNIYGLLGELLKEPDEMGAFLELARSRTDGDSQGDPQQGTLLDFIGMQRVAFTLNLMLELEGPIYRPLLAEAIRRYPDLMAEILDADALREFKPESLEFLMQSLMADADTALRFIRSVDPDVLESLSEIRALDAFRRAAREVPAYRDFLKENHFDESTTDRIDRLDERVPVTTKGNYVAQYALAERCVRGGLPRCGTLDESSGSSGRPTNWVHGVQEDRLLEQVADFAFELLYPPTERAPLVAINTFSTGAWTAGSKFCRLIESRSITKNVGTDPEKVLQTMSTLGPGCRFLLAGYPPFLKLLIDEGTRRGFEWKAFAVDLITGGEGFDEGWRDYMAARLQSDARIYSAYGASDYDLGVAIETAHAKALKRRLATDETLRVKLLGSDRLPCFVGQYNPFLYHIEIQENGRGGRDLVVTLLCPEIAAPKIRYRIGDEGGTIPYRRYREVVTAERSWMKDLLEIPSREAHAEIPFPFIYLFGRSDGTISIDGANVYPENVAEAIHRSPLLADCVSRFRLHVDQSSAGCHRFTVALELREGLEMRDELTSIAAESIIGHLKKINADYRESLKNNPESAKPQIQIFANSTGPFAEEMGIKNRYVY